MGNVLRDGLGNIYGATWGGGKNGGGVLFKLTSKNVESVLYAFCSLSNCADGVNPLWIARSSQGTFYANVLAVNGNVYGGGVVEVTSTGAESVLYNFCQDYFSCLNGKGPTGPLFIQNGMIYGTTEWGGTYASANDEGAGAVYELSQSGVEAVLDSFPSVDSTIGQTPLGGVVVDQSGNLYGTTAGGGAYYSGIVFKLTKQ